MEIARHVRRDHELFLPPQRTVGRERLGLAHVDGGRRDLAAAQRLQQDLARHGVAAPAVDENGAVLHPPEALGRVEVRGLLRAREDGHDHVRLRQDAVDLLRQDQLVHALRAGAAAALHADHPRAHGLHEPCVAQPDIAQAHDQHGRSVEGRDHPVVLPAGAELGAAVQVELFDQHQRHGEGVLGNGEAVGAGRVAEHRFLRQDAPGHVRIRPRGKQLQDVQVLRRGDLFRRHVADDEAGARDLLLRRGGGGRKGEGAVDARFLRRTAEGGLFLFSGLKCDQYVFHGGKLLFMAFIMFIS